MKRIYVAGLDGNPLRDFLLQWSLAYSSEMPVTLLFQGEQQDFPIGEGREAQIHLDNLTITHRIDCISHESRVLITNRQVEDADLILVFLEQHINAWGCARELLERSGQAIDGRIFWDFQASHYDERYWRRGLCSELKSAIEISDFEFILGDKDRSQWLRAQLFNDPTIKRLSRGHRKQLSGLVKWAAMKLAQREVKK